METTGIADRIGALAGAGHLLAAAAEQAGLARLWCENSGITWS